jgi:hypothetical protein
VLATVRADRPVGHSYGGGSHERRDRESECEVLVHVAAYALDAGQTLLAANASAAATRFDQRPIFRPFGPPDGPRRLHRSFFRSLFAGDCPRSRRGDNGLQRPCTRHAAHLGRTRLADIPSCIWSAADHDPPEVASDGCRAESTSKSTAHVAMIGNPDVVNS